MIIESKLDQYRRQVDAQIDSLTGSTNLYMEKIYKRELARVDPVYLMNLVIDDWKFRANHQMHVVGSIQGSWGSGKSLSAWSMKRLLSRIYDVVFKTEYIHVNPFKMLSLLKNGENRQTYIVDEQQKKNVGMLSYTIMTELNDFIEQDRYSQKNLIYCARDIERSPAQFDFRTRSPYMERKENQTCASCKLFDKCSTVFSETFCDIPFYLRRGFPTHFYLDLFMPRITDESTKVYYGTVKIPAPSIYDYQKYDEWKRQNMKRIHEGEKGDYDILVSEAKKIFEKYTDRLIWNTKDGKKRPASTSEMKDIIYEEMLGKYPEKAVDMIVVRLKKIVTEHILAEFPESASAYAKRYEKN